MRPLQIAIDPEFYDTSTHKKVEYTLRTLCDLAGLPCIISRHDGLRPFDVYYGSQAEALFHAPASDGNTPQLLILAETWQEDTGEPTPFQQDDLVFLSFSGRIQKPVITAAEDRALIRNDIIQGSFYLLSGKAESSAQSDRHGRPFPQHCFLYRHHLLHIPIIDRYASFLRQTFNDSHQPEGRWMPEGDFALGLSHDVDYPQMIRWIECLRYLSAHHLPSDLGTLKRIIAGGETFWQFPAWMEQESAQGVRSAFYFCGYQGDLLKYFLVAPDPFYDVKTQPFKRLFGQLIEGGFEIGMHASCRAYEDSTRFQAEKRQVETACGISIRGNRHHYWHLNPKNPAQTALIHEAIGLEYDSSICFERRAGFRYGISAPFHLFDIDTGRTSRCLEIPTAIMDDHLFGYAGLSYFSSLDEEIGAILDETRQVHGTCVIDFHARVQNRTFFPGWGDAYFKILTRAREKGAWIATPGEIASRWQAREARLRKAAGA